MSDRSGRWTYAELRRRSRRLAGWLHGYCPMPGQRVLARMDASRRFAALLYAASYAGCVLVPVSPALRPFQLGPLIADADPDLIVLDRPPTGTELEIAAGRLTRCCPAPGQLPAGQPGRPVAPGSGTALLLYTSGSTATPRAVVCPHRTVRFVTRAVGRCLRYRAGDVVLSALPPAFDYGLYQILLATAAGAHLVLAGTGESVSLAGLLATHRPSVVPVVPPLAAALVRLAGRAGDRPAHRVRLFTNTAAALSPAAARALRERYPGAEVVPMYGATECKRITIGDPDEDLQRPGSVGRPLPGTSVAVVADGRTAPVGSVGEVVVRGPHLMAGYWRDARRTAEVFGTGPDGVRELRTGDHGWLDARGRLYLSGRRDEIYQQRGVRTGALEVEAAALDVPGVRQAAVLPPVGGADAVLAVAADGTPAGVLRQLAERLEAAKLPRRCLVLDRLPVTERGKVDKDRLRHALAPPAGPGRSQ